MLHKVEDLLNPSVLIDTTGFIQAHDESWPQCAAFLGVPLKSTYLNANYPDLYCQWPTFSQAVRELIEQIKLGQCQQGELAVPNHRISVHACRMLGCDQILLRHTEGAPDEKHSLSLSSRELIDSMPLGLVVLDVQGRLVQTNQALKQMFGECLAFILGRGDLPLNYACFSHANTRLKASPVIGASDAQNDAKIKFSLESPWGGRAWFEMDVKVRVNTEAGIGRVFLYISDTTRAKAAQEQLMTAHNRLHLATDGADIGVWEWIPGKGEVIWNEKMYQLFGATPGDMTPPQVWDRALHPEDSESVKYHVKRCLRLKKDVRVDFRVVLPDGSVRHLRSQTRVIHEDEYGHIRVVGVNWDVTGEISTEQRLQSMAYNDALTGLANRTTLMFRLNRALARAMRSGCQMALFMMDVDNFKDINDNFGHPVGDELLRLLAQRVKALVSKPDDTFARIAGDEFAIVVESLGNPRDAETLAERIQEALVEPFYMERGPAVQTSMSIGISVFPDDGKDATTLLKAADLAMYHAKRGGGNAASAYSPSMSAELNQKLAMELMLREASRDESFELYYQPIVRLDSGEITGCEALIRWKDSAGRFVSPLDFIPVAENCGLIPKIGSWVLETAFKQWLLWKKLDHNLSYVSINVSPHQLHETTFSDELLTLAERYGVNPRQVQLEITEGTFLLETKNTDSQLQRLIDMGFRLAIDDFGTGYSSLAYLKRFNVDVIKVDRGFIVDIESNKADREIVNAILAMTESLGFQVLIEGVEEKGQKNIIHHMGCEYAQGFLFGRPTFSDEFAEKYLLQQKE